jgi:hypothetical protein
LPAFSTHSGRRSRPTRAAALLCVAACSGDETCPDADTGAAFVCPDAPALELGTGEQAFEPLVGGVLPLYRGSQGAQHVFVSMRADLDPGPVGRATVRLAAWDGAARAVDAIEVGLGTGDDAGMLLVPGVQLVFPDADAVVGRTIGFAATLTPVGGDGEALGWLEAEVGWAPGNELPADQAPPPLAGPRPAAYQRP